MQDTTEYVAPINQGKSSHSAHDFVIQTFAPECIFLPVENPVRL